MKFVTLISLLSILMAGELDLNADIPLSDVKMQDVSGGDLSLSDIRGENGLLVIFSCNTCPWVIRWQDRYVEIADQFKDDKLGIVAINSNEASRSGVDSFEAMQKHAQENGYNFYYTVDKDSKLAHAFGATRTPHVFLFNGAGKLVYRGAIDDNARDAKNVDEPYLKNAIHSMLEGKTIDMASTKALGCSIKYN